MRPAAAATPLRTSLIPHATPLTRVACLAPPIASAQHPNKLTIVTGQMGKEPKILIWSSRPEKGSRHLPQLCVIQGDHRRAIIGLSFSRTGEYVATMGNDNNRSIASTRPLAPRRGETIHMAHLPRVTPRDRACTLARVRSAARCPRS